VIEPDPTFGETMRVTEKVTIDRANENIEKLRLITRPTQEQAALVTSLQLQIAACDEFGNRIIPYASGSDNWTKATEIDSKLNPRTTTIISDSKKYLFPMLRSIALQRALRALSINDTPQLN
jgi:hypothetical protein